VGDDPAVGSAAVSRPQARFEGSDRQARGRLMKVLSSASIANDDAARVMEVAPERAERLVEALLAEGLVVGDGLRLRLP
jgi:A/G-specific adenine glycosylase